MAYVLTSQTAFIDSVYGVQATWGTAATAFQKSLGFDLKMSQKTGLGEFGTETSMSETAQTQGEKSSEGSIGGRLSPQEGQDFIYSIPAKVPLISKLYTFQLNGTQYMDCFVTGWTVDAKNTEVSMSATIAGKFGTVVTPAAAPACNPIYLFSGGFTLTIDGVEVDDVMSVKIEAQNISRNGFFGEITPTKPVQKKPSIMFSALVGALSVNKALAIQTGKHAIVFSTTQGSYSYSFSGDVFFNDPSEEGNNDDVYAFTMNGKFVSLACDESTNLITVAFLPANGGS